MVFQKMGCGTGRRRPGNGPAGAAEGSRGVPESASPGSVAGRSGVRHGGGQGPRPRRGSGKVGKLAGGGSLSSKRAPGELPISTLERVPPQEKTTFSDPVRTIIGITFKHSIRRR